MPNPFKSVVGKVMGRVIVLVALLGVAGWRLMQPKIKTASMAEVRAVLPKELLETLPPDVAAEERYKKLIALVSSLDEEELGTFASTKTIKQPAATIYARARAFWVTHPSLCNDIMSILAAGPIQWKPAPNSTLFGNDWIPLSKCKTFVKSVTTSARLYGDDKQFNASIKLYVMAITLSDRMIADGCPLINCFEGVAMEAVLVRSLDEALLGGGFSGGNCRQLLATMGPSPLADNYLAVSLRTDFQEYALKFIPDPTKNLKELIWSMTDGSPGGEFGGEENKDEPISGTYDAIETAKLYAKIYSASMSNARQPFSRVDKTIFDDLDKDAKTLPVKAESASKQGFGSTWDRWKYRFAMDNGQNTLGRIIAGGNSAGNESQSAGASCGWRALRDATRIALAARLYRADHAGKLPPTSDGFLSYLGAWPQDPFNGKTMIYNPTKEVVYAVGKNLVDDGGTFDVNVSKSPDVGLSVKR